MLRHSLPVLLLLFFTISSYAQSHPEGSLNNILTSADHYYQTHPLEKLYVHTDKPAYAAGDTLWFKGYLFDQALTNQTVKSRLLYIELANDSNEVVKRMIAPVYRGLTFGQLTLEEELPGGGYTLRAYTHYMRNFGEDYVFSKPFYLSKATTNQWLVTYRPQLSKENGKETLQLGVRLTGFDQVPVGLRELQLRLTDGRRTLLKQNTSTTADGLLDLNLILPETVNAKNLTLTLQDQRKGEGNRIMQVPMPLNRPEHTDLQFLPEGGHLVSGLPATIAFKAIGEDGKGTTISGTIYNNTSQAITTITSEHNGMGSFKLTPQAGESYTAKVTLPGGIMNDYPLPRAEPIGTTLQVTNPLESDTITITIQASPDLAAQGGTYYLVGHARNKVCYGASFNLSKGPVTLQVSKSTFPTGIVHFTLTNPARTPLNERMTYVDHEDELDIEITPDKATYKPREKVTLTIRVTDKNVTPVQGSFSLAVTDDSQVRTDNLSQATIISRMQLTSQLKGTIEDPGYYTNPTSSTSKYRHLDQLLLTQGWTGYSWQDIFTNKPLTYEPEEEYMIKGRVLNMLNKPVSNTAVTLLSKKPFAVKDTLTDEAGAFTFKDLTPSDTTVYFIQSKNKKGNSFNTGIEVDEFEAPEFTAMTNPIQPWYVNADTARLQAVKQQVKLRQTREEKLTGGRTLKEVVITGKRIIKDSKNLNGPGEADIIIDEEQIVKAGKKTLGDLLEEKIQGFNPTYGRGQKVYRVQALLPVLIIDGVSIMYGKPEGIRYFEHFQHYLDYYNAEDIKGIEVMLSGKTQPAYANRYIGTGLEVKYWVFAFIEITTRSGQGPYLKKSEGTYLYKPQPFILPRQFYAPRYTSDSSDLLQDIRSTIHWEPNLVTGKDGTATVSFYTADTPGSYSLILEGADMRGNLGVQWAQIRVEK